MSLPPVSPRGSTCALGHADARPRAAGRPATSTPASTRTRSRRSSSTSCRSHDRPAMLDRAALTFCLADAFHPGCELTWPMRHPTMYAAPFRLRHRAPGAPEPRSRPELTPAAVDADRRPALRPVAGCRHALDGPCPGRPTPRAAGPATTSATGRGYDPYVPTFWAARVPNQVLTQADYEIVMDSSRPVDEREAAFDRRAAWLRWLPGGYIDQINEMVDGVLEARGRPDAARPADGHSARSSSSRSTSASTGDVDPRRNLLTLHVPEAADADRAPAAIRAAVAAFGGDGEHVTAGYVERLDRFRRGRS